MTNSKTLQGVSLISEGEALGHGLFVDAATIAGAAAILAGKTLRSYLTHDNAQADRLGAEVGIFSNFRVSGDRLRADFQFLDAWTEANPQEFATLTELAALDDASFGVSLVGSVNPAWVMADGTEADALNAKSAPPGAIRSQPSIRFREIRSADFVTAPAANSALYSALSKRMSANQTELSNLRAEVARLRASPSDLALAVEVQKDQIAKLEADLATASMFDMRRAGAPAFATGNSLGQGDLPKGPGKHASDQEKWTHFSVLEQLNPTAAEIYRLQNLTPATRR